MSFRIKTFDELSKKELYEILRSRAEVFVKGQKICCIDADGVDYIAYHVFKEEDGRVSAYLRAYPSGEKTVKIGRVLALRRGKGDGGALMRFAMEKLPSITGCERICLDAQKPVIAFYEHLGFVVTSKEYLEEGIVHVDMCREV